MAEAEVLIALCGESKGWLVCVGFWVKVSVRRLVWTLAGSTLVFGAKGVMNE